MWLYTYVHFQNTSQTLDITQKEREHLDVLSKDTKPKPKSLRVQRKRILSGYEDIISINESVKSFKLSNCFRQPRSIILIQMHDL